ncbi:MAG: DUF2779 domain-containing protein [Actinobacteria bacterium]|nr:MAG: DUF2779 domain-containing protein [Actinomycetota bacterium]
MQETRRTPRLSKSRFQLGLQCAKGLWLKCHRPELADPIDESQQAIFDQGTEVGRLAQRRFPGGVLIDEPYYETASALESTARALEAGAPALFEAAFEADGVLVRVDILNRVGSQKAYVDEAVGATTSSSGGTEAISLAGGEGERRRVAGTFDLVEVKSSTKRKEEHVTDLAIQRYVLEKCGVGVDRALLMHLNHHYIYQSGEHDPLQAFAFDDATEDVSLWLPEIPSRLAQMCEMLAGEMPEMTIGRHCSHPYVCSFHGFCHQGLPEYPVTELPRKGRDLLDQLIREGIWSIKDIPEHYEDLTKTQRRVRRVVVEGRPWFSETILEILGGLRYPLYFLDFETLHPALPVYAGTHPYLQIPFQFSLHVLERGESVASSGTEPDDDILDEEASAKISCSLGRLTHHEFLWEEPTDPRPALIPALLDALGTEGSIIVYTHFENTILRYLAEAYPQYAEQIEAVQGRLFDLEKEVIREHTMHPEYRGSTSIKHVLPALVPELSYDDLAIDNGDVATLRYVSAVFGEASEGERQKIFKDLKEYCGRDTLAMVRLLEAVYRSKIT